MRLHDLGPGKGATKNRKRVGRGIGSGHGKTSGRGQKGQLSRSGGGKGPGFEGGQTPIQRQLPKARGFRNPFKKIYAEVNLDQLSKFKEKSVVDPEVLREAGLIRKNLPVKVLGRGDVGRPLTVKAHAFSATASERIQAAGGTAEVIE